MLGAPGTGKGTVAGIAIHEQIVMKAAKRPIYTISCIL